MSEASITTLPEELIEHVFFQLRIQLPKHADRTLEQIEADRSNLQTLVNASRASKITYRTARKALWHTIDLTEEGSMSYEADAPLWQVLRVLSEQPDTANLVQEVFLPYSNNAVPSFDLTDDAHRPVIPANELRTMLQQQERLPEWTRGGHETALRMRGPDAGFATLLCMCENVTVLVMSISGRQMPVLTFSVSGFLPGVSIRCTRPALQHLQHLGVTKNGRYTWRRQMRIVDMPLWNLGQTLLNLPTLHSFRATGLETDPAGDEPLPHIKKVTLIHPDDSDGMGFRPLLRTLPKLETLAIEGYRGDGSSDRTGAWPLCKCLAKCTPELTTLIIPGDDYWDDSASPISSIGSLAKLKNLRQLLIPFWVLFGLTADPQYDYGPMPDLPNLPLVDILPPSLESLTIDTADANDWYESRLDAQLLQLMEDQRFDKLERICLSRRHPVSTRSSLWQWTTSSKPEWWTEQVARKLEPEEVIDEISSEMDELQVDDS